MNALTKMTRSTLLIAILPAMILTGCGEDSPVAPTMEDNGPVAEVKIPKTLRLSSVKVKSLPARNSSGGPWDTYNPLAPSTQYPDVFVKLGNYETNSVNNTNSVDATLSFKPGEGGMSISPTASYTLKVYDEDDLSADDLMSSVSFKPYDYYNRNNETTAAFVLNASNGVSIACKGTWIY